MMERSATAVMLLPVRRRFEVELWSSPTTLWDPSSKLSKDLFFPDGRETAGEGAREAAGEGTQEAAGEGAREAAGEGTMEMDGEGALDPAGDGGSMLVSSLYSRMGVCSGFVVEDLVESVIPAKPRESKSAHRLLQHPWK